MAINKDGRNLPKILAVLGPTSSGKSDLAVELALKFNGEVISADSRQVYRGLDIATGKITKEEMRGVPHHLLDVADPEKQYSVTQFKHDAEKVITEILSRGRLPIICGVTGLYADAVIDNVITPEVPPNEALRKELAQKTTDELFFGLQKIAPERAKNIDPKNPRRLVRALEIARALGTVSLLPEAPKNYETFQIAIETKNEVLRERIKNRVEKRMQNGMVEEAKSLHENGLSYERMNDLGLEYRFLAQYLQGEISKEKMVEEIIFKDWQYAKRQMTWLRKNKNIHWFSLEEIGAVVDSVKQFLKTS